MPASDDGAAGEVPQADQPLRPEEEDAREHRAEDDLVAVPAHGEEILLGQDDRGADPT